MEPQFQHVFDGLQAEHYIVLFGAATCLVAVVGFASAWIGAYVGARRAARKTLLEALASTGRSGQVGEARLGQLVDAVDAIALEVERISEAQRFTARLLAERQAPAAPAVRRDPGVITPH